MAGAERDQHTTPRFETVKRELAALGDDLSTPNDGAGSHDRFAAFLDAIRADVTAVAVLDGAPARAAAAIVPPVALSTPPTPAPEPDATWATVPVRVVREVRVVPERVPVELAPVMPAVVLECEPIALPTPAPAPAPAPAEAGITDDLERAFWNDDASRWTSWRPRFSRARILEGSACIATLLAALVRFG